MNTTSTHYLQRLDGRVAFDVAGDGPLVVMIPGMGDLRTTFRYLAPALRDAGYRVACIDLRGHGDSDATFSQYGDEATARDVEALVDELGGPAVLVGNSMGAGAAALVAAGRSELVSGLVLVGPFVRDSDGGRGSRLLTRIAMAGPWAARAWRAYLPTLYAGRAPDDLDAHFRDISASLARPGYVRAFRQTTRTTHSAAEAVLADISAPALIVMGESDPDWPDPAAEAHWIADVLGGEVAMIPDAGHYPHSQQPEATFAALRPFLTTLAPRA